jgi:hypothetical protein
VLGHQLVSALNLAPPLGGCCRLIEELRIDGVEMALVAGEFGDEYGAPLSVAPLRRERSRFRGLARRRPDRLDPAVSLRSGLAVSPDPHTGRFAVIVVGRTRFRGMSI